ncbi:hypothetical protein D9M72_420900 [compost metagenome]
MAGAVVLVEIDIAGAERLELYVPVAEEGVGDRTEIILTDIHVEVFAPIVVPAFEADGAAGLERSDLVGAGAHDRFKRRAADVAFVAFLVLPFPPMLRQDRELAENVWQFVVVLLVEAESNVALARLFRRNDVAVVVGQERIVLLHLFKREDDILRRHWLAVRPLRLGAKTKSGGGNIIGIGDALG